MLKPIVSLAAIGLFGVVLYKVLWLLLLPVVGTLAGFVALMIKVALIVGLVWLGFYVFRKLTERPSEA